MVGWTEIDTHTGIVKYGAANYWALIFFACFLQSLGWQIVWQRVSSLSGINFCFSNRFTVVYLSCRCLSLCRTLARQYDKVGSYVDLVRRSFVRVCHAHSLMCFKQFEVVSCGVGSNLYGATHIVWGRKYEYIVIYLYYAYRRNAQYIEIYIYIYV